ncbi:MAG: T9SS type A sorting domain-containing protein [Bacteroidetes bacterium]|nr:T9SS type A sorting domain-containing protein [Bacteroidota bacterium]
MKPFTVFPNPAQSTLHYSEQPSGLFSVYDMGGKQVLQGNTDSNGEIDIKTLTHQCLSAQNRRANDSVFEGVVGGILKTKACWFS